MRKKLNHHVPETVITPSDFFAGFFSGLASRMPGRTFRCGERFNEALKIAYDRLVNKTGVKASFLIQLDPLHGDSSTINEGLIGAVRRDMISLDNPSFEKFRLKLEADEAEEILKHVRGGHELYKQLVKDFLNEYSEAGSAAATAI